LYEVIRDCAKRPHLVSLSPANRIFQLAKERRFYGKGKKWVEKEHESMKLNFK